MKNLFIILALIFTINLQAQSKDDSFKKEDDHTLIIERTYEVKFTRDEIKAKLQDYDNAIQHLIEEKAKYEAIDQEAEKLDIQLKPAEPVYEDSTSTGFIQQPKIQLRRKT